MSKNIVIFGGPRAGKSSVVNLIAGQEIARTSPGTERCTLQWQEYPITFDGCDYKVFDTVGLAEPQDGMREYLNVIVNAHNMITTLNHEGGIDLLLFCVRAGDRVVTETLQTNYRLFYEWWCEKKVPIVLILTGLEGEQNMEDWWTKYERIFARYKIRVDSHACITAANNLDGRARQLYEDSQRLVRDLVKTHTTQDNWWTRLSRGVRGLLPGYRRNKYIMGVLTKHCHIPRHAAKELTAKIKYD